VASSGETQRHHSAEVLRVEGLTVRYGALIALHDVSWSVRSGEILGSVASKGTYIVATPYGACPVDVRL
jgi:branched-chain amino acid transport system ATP-binding protein